MTTLWGGGTADIVNLHSHKDKDGYYPVPNPLQPGANQVQVDTRHSVGVCYSPTQRDLVGPIYVVDPKTKKAKLDKKRLSDKSGKQTLEK